MDSPMYVRTSAHLLLLYQAQLLAHCFCLQAIPGNMYETKFASKAVAAATEEACPAGTRVLVTSNHLEAAAVAYASLQKLALFYLSLP